MPPLALVLAALVSPLSISLPSGAVDGRPILGRTVPQVEAAVGRPRSSGSRTGATSSTAAPVACSSR